MQLFIGPTGGGKSTLVNLILGRPLIINDECIQNDLNQEISEKEIIKVSGGFESITSIPQAVKFEDYYLIDTPGFGDTRGLKYAIFSIYCLKQISLIAKSVKIGLCFDYATAIERRGCGLFNSFKSLKESYILADQNEECFLLIIQKVDRLRNVKKVIEESKLVSRDRIFYFNSPNNEANPDEELGKLYTQGKNLFKKFKKINGEKFTQIFVDKLFTDSEKIQILDLYTSQQKYICSETKKINEQLEKYTQEKQIDQLERYKSIASKQIEKLILQDLCCEILQSISENFLKNLQENKDEKIKQIAQNIDLRLNNLYQVKSFKIYSNILFATGLVSALCTAGAGLTFLCALEAGGILAVRVGGVSLITSVLSLFGSKCCLEKKNEYQQKCQKKKNSD